MVAGESERRAGGSERACQGRSGQGSPPGGGGGEGAGAGLEAGEGFPRSLGTQGAAPRAATRWHRRRPTCPSAGKPAPTRCPSRPPPAAVGAAPAHLLQPFHAAGSWPVGSLAEPRARGETTGRQALPGSWALRAPGHESRESVPPGCGVLIPQRLSRRLTERRACEGRESVPVSAVAPRTSGSSGEQGGRELAPSRIAAFHSLSPRRASACGQRGGKAEGLHLFLSHCSLGKEMTAGVSHFRAASTFLLCHTCRALPCPGAAVGFQAQFLTPLGLCQGFSLWLWAGPRPSAPPPNPLANVLCSVS